MIRKATHMILTAVVLISTMGITVNMHFCHEQLIDLALYAPAESCCGGDESRCHSGAEGLMPAGHCANESIVLEALEDFMGSTFAFGFENIKVIDVFSGWIGIPAISEPHILKVPEYYFPPPVQEVDLTQIQVFLI